MKMFVVGDVYVETQYFVDEISIGDQFVIATDATSVYGSKTINASRILSRSDNEVTFFAHAGNDKDGENAVAAIKNWGINPDLKLLDQEKTGKMVVITNSLGKSAVTLYRGANQTITSDIVQTLESKFGQFDGVYTATNLELEALYKLASICEKQTIPILLDVPNQHTSLDLSRVRSVDFFCSQ